MSIISEALKKAQNKRHDKESAITSAYDVVSSEETFEAPKFLEDVPLLTPESPNIKTRTWTSKGFIALAVVFAVIASLLFFSGIKKPKSSASLDQDITVITSSGSILTSGKTNLAPSAKAQSSKKIKKVNLPVLSGIMYSPTNPQAVINGVLVSEGEIVGGFTLTKIYPASVKITSGSDEFILSMQ